MKTLEEILEAVGSTATFLFEGVSDINQKSNFGDTPLHVVSGWGNVDAVQTLILAGANVNNTGETGRTPLFAAIMNGSSEVIKLLLEQGADPLITDEEGQTPLMFAKNILPQENSEKTIIINMLETAINKVSTRGTRTR